MKGGVYVTCYIVILYPCNMSNPMTRTMNKLKWMRNKNIIDQYDYVVLIECIREDAMMSGE
mgnify:FL=1